MKILILIVMLLVIVGIPVSCSHSIDVYNRIIASSPQPLKSCEDFKSEGDAHMSRFHNATHDTVDIDADIAAAQAAVISYRKAIKCGSGDILQDAQDNLAGLLKAKTTKGVKTVEKELIDPHLNAGKKLSQAVDKIQSRK